MAKGYWFAMLFVSTSTLLLSMPRRTLAFLSAPSRSAATTSTIQLQLPLQLQLQRRLQHSNQNPSRCGTATLPPSRGIHRSGIRSSSLLSRWCKSRSLYVHVHVLHNSNNNDNNNNNNSYRPQDSLVAGIAEIGTGFSIGVLYSEYFIIATGCGAPNFGDTLERICYQGVIVFAGLALFNRVATLFSSSLEETAETLFGPLLPSTLWQVRIAEFLAFASVVGALVALQTQYSKGAVMDGMSGIDINWCRAVRGDTVL